MIKCNYKIVDSNISYIHISGHANAAEYGSDIVCAGVSMLSFSIGNALLNLSEDFNLTIDENAFIFIDNLQNEKSTLLLKTLFDGLLMVKDQYSDFIEIKEV